MSEKLIVSDSMVMRITKFSIDADSWRDRAWLPEETAWFFSNCIYIKVGKNSDATRIEHICDINKALNIENINSHLGINV